MTNHSRGLGLAPKRSPSGVCLCARMCSVAHVSVCFPFSAGAWSDRALLQALPFSRDGHEVELQEGSSPPSFARRVAACVCADYRVRPRVCPPQRPLPQNWPVWACPPLISPQNQGTDWTPSSRGAHSGAQSHEAPQAELQGFCHSLLGFGPNFIPKDAEPKASGWYWMFQIHRPQFWKGRWCFLSVSQGSDLCRDWVQRDEPHRPTLLCRVPSPGQGSGRYSNPSCDGAGRERRRDCVCSSPGAWPGCGCSRKKQCLLPAGRILTGVTQVEGPRLRWAEGNCISGRGRSMC